LGLCGTDKILDVGIVIITWQIVRVKLESPVLIQANWIDEGQVVFTFEIFVSLYIQLCGTHFLVSASLTLQRAVVVSHLIKQIDDLITKLPFLSGGSDVIDNIN